MATTRSGFLTITTGGSVTMVAVPQDKVSSVRAALSGTRIDYQLVDLSRSTYAKNGAVRLTFSGTTPKTVDLTATTTNAQSYAGDTAFATFTQMILYNDGVAAVAVAPGASNGASLPFASLTIAPGARHVLTFPSAVTVDSSHKSIDCTPTSGGSLVLMVGGS